MLREVRDYISREVVKLARRIGGYETLISERDRLRNTANRQIILLSRWRKKTFEYVKGHEQERTQREGLEAQVQDLDIQNEQLRHELNVQKQAIGHLQIAKRDLERLSRDASNLAIDKIKKSVLYGCNPDNPSEEGKYVFIDRHGVMYFSPEVGKIIGKSSGSIGYRDVILPEMASEIDGIQEDKVFERLPIRMFYNDKERLINLKKVTVKPIILNGIYFGTIADFETINRFERYKNIVIERAIKTAKRAARKASDMLHRPDEESGIESA